MAIDPASPVPKYLQLRDLLLDWIVETGLSVDDPVPSERELGARYDLSRMTVRQTIDLLCSEGKLYRVPGKGTFVARPKIEMSLALASFTQDMLARGYRPGARDLIRRIIPASGHIARMMDIPPGSPVHHIERLRTADDEPMAVERSNIPVSIAPNLDSYSLSGRSLYQILEQEFGILLDSGEQTIEAGICDAADARLLGLPHGSPVLSMQRRSFGKGACVELAISTYRADRYQLHSRLDPRQNGG
ncbi:GntR family transcriptional regulator [Nocardiopsis mwathae]|uniref:GntR family transcriptional regulator n=1 Tax=Nocardiopsis mwathae TaxID=1472723 RepID=A0A7W9YDT8_9ACTN|nr:GntR family transcriptional regulator [Nocardiopsis mwathae]MBB6170145.1 GntR family transcriptional regulator [Nocardiopsis mwathae]